MPILETFCLAFEQAIGEYEAQADTIPAYRQQEIQALRIRFTECRRDAIDSMEFRAEMVDYVNKISVGFFAFIPVFDSRLRKKLQAVLADPKFSESILSLNERKQDRDGYRSEITGLRTQITQLTDQLNRERAQDSRQAIQSLTHTVEQQQQTIDFMTARNQQLTQSLQVTVDKYGKLQTDYEALSENYKDLESKYEALLKEQSPVKTNRL